MVIYFPSPLVKLTKAASLAAAAPESIDSAARGSAAAR
jgi:hypothetical protein